MPRLYPEYRILHRKDVYGEYYILQKLVRRRWPFRGRWLDLGTADTELSAKAKLGPYMRSDPPKPSYSITFETNPHYGL